MSWTGYMFGQPRAINPDGTTNIYCRLCGRVVARAWNPRIRTVTRCGACLLTEQGLPREHALPQYAIPDPTKPPVPLEEAGDPMWFFEPGTSSNPELEDSHKLFGTARQFFRALFWIKEAQPEPPKSTKVSKRTRNQGLFSDD